MSKKCEACDARHPVNYYDENFYCNDCIDEVVYYAEVCNCDDVDDDNVCLSCQIKENMHE